MILQELTGYQPLEILGAYRKPNLVVCRSMMTRRVSAFWQLELRERPGTPAVLAPSGSRLAEDRLALVFAVKFTR